MHHPFILIDLLRVRITAGCGPDALLGRL